MHGYSIEKTGTGRFYLMHGQSTHGQNNGVPVASLAEAWRIAEAWRVSGVRLPYPAQS